ncbi:hypothetical protein TKK_0008163 [Trichogramma kaykai]
MSDPQNRNQRHLSIPSIENTIESIPVPNSNTSSQSSSQLLSSEIEENESPEFLVADEKVCTNKVHYIETAIIAQRYGLSDGAVAAIVSSVLVDHGLVDEENQNLVVDKNEKRIKKDHVNKKIAISPENQILSSIYFDGRKDETLIQEKIENKYRIITMKEEHISVLTEPDSIYIGHVVPKSAKAEDILMQLLSAINKSPIFVRAVCASM